MLQYRPCGYIIMPASEIPAPGPSHRTALSDTQGSKARNLSLNITITTENSPLHFLFPQLMFLLNKQTIL